MEAFVLGLSNGSVCLAYCTPVLVPCLLAARRSVAQSVLTVLAFLGGRLAGYLVFGLLSWALGRSFLEGFGHREIVVGLAYMALSVMLVLFGFFGRFHHCRVPATSTLLLRLGEKGEGISSLVPALAGLATGLNFCPPFLLAVTGAASEGSLFQSLLFFALFFAGTSLFLIPAPFLGLLRRFPQLAVVGKLAAGIVGLYYFYSGIIMFSGGIKSL